MFDNLTESIGALKHHIDVLEQLLFIFPDAAFIVFDTDYNHVFGGGELFDDSEHKTMIGKNLLSIDKMFGQSQSELKVFYDECLDGKKLKQNNITFIPVYNGKPKPIAGLIVSTKCKC